MPTIRRFSTGKIAIYADDHPPPHFHIEGSGFRLIVNLDDFSHRGGDGRRCAEAMDWARQNHALRLEQWQVLNCRRS